MTQPAAKTLGLFHSDAELNALIDHGPCPGTDGLTLIAMSPAADYAAERRGVACKTIEDACGLAALNELGLENCRRSASLCEAIDAAATDLPPARRGGVSAMAFYYSFRLLTDTMLGYALSLIRLLEQERPGAVLYVRRRVAAGDFLPHLIAADEVLPLIDLIARTRGVVVRAIPAGATPPASAGRGALSRIQANARSVVRRASARLATICRSPQATLVGDRFWPLATARRLSARSIRFLDIPQGSPPPPAASAIDRAALRRLLEPFFVIDGVSCYDAVEARLLHFTDTWLPQAAATLAVMKDFLERTAASAVITRAPIDLPHVALVLAAREAGVPVIVAQHGGGNGYQRLPFVWSYDRYFTDHYFCYGPGVAAYFRTAPDSYHLPRPLASMTPHVIGSATLHAIRQARGLPRPPASAGKRSVLYVPTNLYGPFRPYSQQSPLDIAYWRLQREVVRTCMAEPGIDLTVKAPHHDGAQNPLQDWIIDAGFTDCRVIRTLLSETLLTRRFDLIICDAPATSLLEALATDTPIVALLDKDVTDVGIDARALLSRRAVVTSTPAEYFSAITAALSTPAVPMPEPVNDDFLHCFGLPGDIVDPGEALADAIEAVCRGSAARSAGAAGLREGVRQVHS